MPSALPPGPTVAGDPLSIDHKHKSTVASQFNGLCERVLLLAMSRSRLKIDSLPRSATVLLPTLTAQPMATAFGCESATKKKGLAARLTL